MPLVEVTLRQGRSSDTLRSIGDAIHEALVATANVPPDDRFQIFHTVPDTQLMAHPTYGGVNRSPDLLIIRVTLNAGRTLEIKKAFYADLVRRLGSAAGVRPDDVLVSLVEVAKENWSFGNGLATYG